MIFSKKTAESINRDILRLKDQEIENTPFRVHIDGMDMQIDSEDKTGGEVNLYLGTPVYCPNTEKFYKLVPLSKDEMREIKEAV